MNQVPKEANELIQEEEQTLTNTLKHLEEQVESRLTRTRNERARARELTAQLVGTRRQEDKALIASDEAVSHALCDANEDALEVLEKQQKQPYFARLVVREELRGREQSLEYKIGFNTNLDCRIIDWRKAPISKLYYEYREGDDYSEVIHGQEREGTVLLRNVVDIQSGQLKKVSCRHGQFAKENGNWVQTAARNQSRENYGSLPPILSLITADQFSTITSHAETAILIQGVAGSGKTTVALHRLAWLLHEDNSDVSHQDALVLVRSPALRQYIENSLSILQIKEIQVLTYREWLLSSLRKYGLDLRVSLTETPRSFQRVKQSLAVLKVVEKLARNRVDVPAFDILKEVFQSETAISENDDTGLISAALIKETRQYTLNNYLEESFDACDLALLLRIIQIKGGEEKLSCLVVDEAQDFSVPELATLVSAVKDVSRLTVVGDTAQELTGGKAFPGWERLRELWAFKEATSHYIKLTVSHRSTKQIMKLASAIIGGERISSKRIGRIPIWFRCSKETDAIGAAQYWASKALEKYPTALTAILCRNKSEASYAYDMLKAKLGTAIRLVNDKHVDLAAGVLVAPIESVKGLEFTNIVVWNPSTKNFPDNDDASRNALYVAVTRAEENVCIVSWENPCAYLSGLRPDVIRIVE